MTETERDQQLNRQIIRAMQKISFGQYVGNPALVTLAEIMLRDLPEAVANCSNGQNRCAMYVGPHPLPKAAS